jgi:hypothetical protein
VQTYVIRAASPEGRAEGKREVLFKCGNWCYEGSVDFSESIEGVDSIPYIIPELQRQQGRLGFYCSANKCVSAPSWRDVSKLPSLPRFAPYSTLV